MTTTNDFTKIIRPAHIQRGVVHPNIQPNVYIKIEYRSGKLSLSGVIGPRSNGNTIGGCGQIDMEFSHRDPANNDSRYGHMILPSEMSFAPGWNAERWYALLDIWRKWHLNDMRPGCEHQQGWNTGQQLIITKENGKQETNTAGWVYPEEHPEGLLTKPCPECGYKYGTAWKFCPVPEDVLDFLHGLPDTDKTPAWV